jgi:hypothetical protein
VHLKIGYANRDLDKGMRLATTGTMTTENIGRDSWREELDSFSRRHEGWLVSITTRGPGGNVAVEARDMPFQGVSLASPHSGDIAITVGDSRTHLTHEVRETAAVEIELTANQAERALVIHGNDGTTTTIDFRSPTLPEEVDGLPGPNHQPRIEPTVR